TTGMRCRRSPAHRATSSRTRRIGPPSETRACPVTSAHACCSIAARRGSSTWRSRRASRTGSMGAPWRWPISSTAGCSTSSWRTPRPGRESVAVRDAADLERPRGRPAARDHGAPMTTAPAQAPARPLVGIALDPKYLIVFLITLVLVVGEARYGILGGYQRLATTLGICVATEVFLSWFLRGRVVNISSAYITGISLALLIKPQANMVWPFALGAFLAIASKYVLTYRGRHLWNPSNFAIALLLLLAANSVAVLSHQWGNDLGTNLVIWAFGLVIA